MNKMIRKQVFITAEQNKRLKTEAAAAGISEAELVRAGIDMRLEHAAEKTDWRRLADSLSGAWAERDDLDDLVKKRRQSWKKRRKRLGLTR